MTTPKDKATPRPWIAALDTISARHPGTECCEMVARCATDRMPIAEITGYDQALANAALIARAVNTIDQITDKAARLANELQGQNEMIGRLQSHIDEITAQRDSLLAALKRIERTDFTTDQSRSQPILERLALGTFTHT